MPGTSFRGPTVPATLKTASKFLKNRGLGNLSLILCLHCRRYEELFDGPSGSQVLPGREGPVSLSLPLALLQQVSLSTTPSTSWQLELKAGSWWPTAAPGCSVCRSWQPPQNQGSIAVPSLQKKGHSDLWPTFPPKRTKLFLNIFLCLVGISRLSVEVGGWRSSGLLN